MHPGITLDYTVE